jgi:serine/threonine protein kinase
MNTGYVKLADPGLPIPISAEFRKSEYCAPELIPPGSGPPQFPSDFYGLGVLIYEMLTGMPAFFDPDPERLQVMVTDGVLRFPGHVSKEARDLVSKLMARNIRVRLAHVEMTKTHSFFGSVDWNMLETKQVKPEWIPDSSDQIFKVIEEVEDVASRNLSKYVL